MSIRVTCSGCHTRFNVSEKFAGREGPCPKCKKTITIPKASDEVTVHVPESYGPMGASGVAVLKPIFRKDTRLTSVQLVLIFAFIFGIVAVALVLRFGVADKDNFSSIVLGALSIVVAAPCAFAGYTFLRDSELASLSGSELWIRIGVCALVYGLSWSAFYIANHALIDDYGTATRIFAMAAMFVVGALASWLLLGLDFMLCILHFGLFFGCCLLLRIIIGFAVLPGPLNPVADDLVTALLIYSESITLLVHSIG